MLTLITPGGGASVKSCSALDFFLVGEGGRLAADREVAPLRPADVVLGHQDPAQIGVAVEDDSEEVEDFALLELGGGEEGDAGVDFWKDHAVGRGSCRCRGPTAPSGR